MPQISVTRLMLMVGVVGLNFGLAWWMYTASSVCFADVLPLILCLELGWWRRSRSRGPVRAFWSRFLLTSVVAWSLILAILGLVAFEDHDVRLPFGLVLWGCKQLVYGIDPKTGFRIEVDYPVIHMAVLYSIQCSLGLWGAWVLGGNLGSLRMPST